MSYQIILFDLDGTVTDSGPGIMNSVQYALDKFGIGHQERAKLRRFVGPPLSDSFERFYGFSHAEALKAVEYYREYYSAGGIFENEVYEGMKETLQALKEDGRRIYLATSKPQVFSEQILEHFGLKDYFDGVVGSFLDGGRTDKAEIIAEVLHQAGITAEKKSEVLMVGDREYDMIGAHKQGIAAVGALYGYGSRDELEQAGADFIVESPKELLSLV